VNGDDKQIASAENTNKSKSKMNFFEIPKENEIDIVWDFKLPTKTATAATNVAKASKELTHLKEEIKQPLEEM